MGNILSTFKRFLANKNTVTIIGVLAGLAVLFIGYNYRVNSAVSKVSVPVAKRTIAARTTLTNDLITQTEVLSSMVSGKNNTIIRSTSNLINANDPYCVAIGTSIPAGAFFHNEQVVKCGSVNGNYLRNMPDGYSPVSIKVDLHSTYGNSMLPGDYIDLYAKMTRDGKLIYTRLISKLPILAVVDSRGVGVFDTATPGTPAELVFAVPNKQEDYNLYSVLSKAILLGSGRVELIPVPGNASYTETEGETRITSHEMIDLILANTIEIGEDVEE